jgi:hypothetical protein
MCWLTCSAVLAHEMQEDGIQKFGRAVNLLQSSSLDHKFSMPSSFFSELPPLKHLHIDDTVSVHKLCSDARFACAAVIASVSDKVKHRSIFCHLLQNVG